MPKRIVDGEALWGSSKIASLPVWAKAELANLIPLALANGVFECDVRSVWSRVYSFNRPEVTPDQVSQILGALEKAQLIHRFKDKNGKFWGYFIGIHKPGRLPPPSRMDSKHVTCGPEPPQRLVRQWLANGSLGLGLGSGSGFGSGKSLNPPIVPPAGGQEPKSTTPTPTKKQYVDWQRQIIEIECGNRSRILRQGDWDSLQGSRAEDVLARIRARGFVARIVPKEEVDSWQTKPKTEMATA